jgi:hypothetical protein
LDKLFDLSQFNSSGYKRPICRDNVGNNRGLPFRKMTSIFIRILVFARPVGSAEEKLAMNHPRFQQQLGLAPLSTLSAPVAAAENFIFCPVVLLQGWMGPVNPWQAVYQAAFERAQAVVRPSRLERLERAISWN